MRLREGDKVKVIADPEIEAVFPELARDYVRQGSDLLVNMQGLQTRWAEPMNIVYPEYVTWFDFPFTVWMGPETSAAEKNAALEFEKYLLSEEVQKQALAYGLRPANPAVPVTGEDSLFDQWAGQGVLGVVPRTTAMRSKWSPTIRSTAAVTVSPSAVWPVATRRRSRSSSDRHPGGRSEETFGGAAHGPLFRPVPGLCHPPARHRGRRDRPG